MNQGITQSPVRYHLIYLCLLFGIPFIICFAYAIRIRRKGWARFDRVEKQGSCFLLSREMMEMGYWCLQPVARLLVWLRVSPNFLSWLSLAFGLGTAISFASGYFGCGAGLAAISASLDVLDGLVARMSGVASDAGEVLDAAVDRYVEFLFLGGIVVYYRDIGFAQMLSLIALSGSFMVSYSSAKAEALAVKLPPAVMRRPERTFYLIVGAALSPLSLRYWEEGTTAYPLVAALALIGVFSHRAAIYRLWLIACEVRRREASWAKPGLPSPMEA